MLDNNAKKAAEAWAPGSVTTDIGGMKEKSLISCFLWQRYERLGGWEKTCISQSCNNSIGLNQFPLLLFRP